MYHSKFQPGLCITIENKKNKLQCLGKKTFAGENLSSWAGKRDKKSGGRRVTHLKKDMCNWQPFGVQMRLSPPSYFCQSTLASRVLTVKIKSRMSWYWAVLAGRPQQQPAMADGSKVRLQVRPNTTRSSLPKGSLWNITPLEYRHGAWRNNS